MTAWKNTQFNVMLTQRAAVVFTVHLGCCEAASVVYKLQRAMKMFSYEDHPVFTS